MLNLNWLKRSLKSSVRGRFFRSYGAHARAILAQAKSGYFLVSPEDAHVGKQLLRSGEYNPQERDTLLSLVDGTSSVLVVGAHIGALVVPLAQKAREVVAVEANPHTFELLKLNLQLNHCSNVSAIQLAASDSAEALQFLLSRENSGGSKRMPKIMDKRFTYDRPEVATVPAAPLDEVFVGRSFDVILMDIEGSEYFALRGMPRLLQSAQALLVEFRPEHLNKVAGVTVKEFLDTIPARFSQATLSSRNQRFNRLDLERQLQDLFERGENEDAIIFLPGTHP
jgi:FkbM family methyltransferase